MKYKKRESFSSLSKTVQDLFKSNVQFAFMVMFWGRACNSLQAQNRVLLEHRISSGSIEMLEVSNEEMDQMRQYIVAGIPVFFSVYLNGVIKTYPVLEQF